MKDWCDEIQKQYGILGVWIFHSPWNPITPSQWTDPPTLIRTLFGFVNPYGMLYNPLYRFFNIMPYKINCLIGIPQTAVTRDFYKQGALWACPKISLTRPFPEKINRLAGNTETGRHTSFHKIPCPTGMSEKSFYTVRMNPSYDTP